MLTQCNQRFATFGAIFLYMNYHCSYKVASGDLELHHIYNVVMPIHIKPKELSTDFQVPCA